MNDEILNAWSKLLVTMANNRRDELTDIDELLNAIGKPIMEATPTKQPTQQEFNSLKYTERVSEKGPYRLITKAENQNNPAFETLRSYIAQKNGFCQIHGFKAWIFSNDPENKIGIRKQ